MQIQWVGLPLADPWYILIELDRYAQVWCVTVLVFTLIHMLARPEMRRWSSLVLLAAVGISLSCDLFHMYVWLELITFAFVGFASSRETLIKYWSIQIFATMIVLIGTVMIYRDMGTLTLLGQNASQVSLNFWLIGWLIKSGAISTWLIDGYQEVDQRDMFYVGAIFTKIGLLPLFKVWPLPFWLEYLGAFNIVFGVYLALTQQNSRAVLCSHIISQVGIILIAVCYDRFLAMSYLIHHMLAKGLLLECIERSKIRVLGIFSLAGLPLSVNFFIKYSIFQASGNIFVLLSSFLTICSLQKYFWLESTEDSWVAIALAGLIVFWNCALYWQLNIA